MVFVRLRRCAWVLVLVLVAGLSLPALAAAAAPGASGHDRARAHVHAAGSGGHGHDAPDRVQAAAEGSKATPQHCPCCLTAADCALSCFGVALLAAAAEWAPRPIQVAWAAFPSPVQPGVAPAGDIDPPRPARIG